MITLDAYWMGRDKMYPQVWTGQVQRSGAETVGRSNMLLAAYFQGTGRILDRVSSGWRPKVVNDATSNAGKTSNHITAEAIDVTDHDRAFAAWCVLNPKKLEECGLWMEDPRWCAKFDEKTDATYYWVHLQTVPPNSGKRIYRPSMAAPLAPALPGQKPLPFQPKI